MGRPEMELVITPDLYRRAVQEQVRRSCFDSFQSFFHATRPNKNYIYGRHTLGMIDILDKTLNTLLKNCKPKSGLMHFANQYYIIINVPFRHGKSDITSRRFPTWALIRDPNLEIILTSYNYELATDMSYEARRLFRQWGPLYGLSIPRDRGSAGAWKVQYKNGGMFAAGIGGTITGRGAHILIIDDYLKNREEAESETVRNSTWNSFQSDLMTRLAPYHVVIIVATRWHQDDLVGRILNRNNPRHKDYDPQFPKFDHVVFPAESEDGSWLFSERFGEKWYQTMKSALGSYAWAALGNQNPQPRGGNMLKVDRVRIVNSLPKGLRWVRGWDLASSEKQLSKENPDFTVGTKAAYFEGEVYVADVVRGQWSAGTRDRIMKDTARRDGPGTEVHIEAVGGYKDTFVHMQQALSGKTAVRSFSPSKDKVARAVHIEPLFEAGKVNILNAPWNQKWLEELAAFPTGEKDDQVDSLVIATYEALADLGFQIA